MRAFVAVALLALCGAVAVTAIEPLSEMQYQNFFSGFVKQFDKKYTHDEFFGRYNIFKANYNKIRAHNAGKSSYSMAVNEFADLTLEEFTSRMLGYQRIDRSLMRERNAPSKKVLMGNDEEIDWREKNAVTPVKNQQQCGSCWAFSATGSMEGMWAIKTGSLVSMSEQQLVDCSRSQGNHGCNGGLMDYAFQYVISNKGITSTQAYPYTARDGQCNKNVTAVATISSFVDVKSGSEDALMEALRHGPVSVAIQADRSCFQFYSGGVLDDKSCGTQLNHGVTLVGSGIDTATGTPYYIVKNSWGQSWGEGGYIRMVRGKNQCGIALEASYAVV